MGHRTPARRHHRDPRRGRRDQRPDQHGRRGGYRSAAVGTRHDRRPLRREGRTKRQGSGGHSRALRIARHHPQRGLRRARPAQRRGLRRAAWPLPRRARCAARGGRAVTLPKHVTIREVSLRDGLQIENPLPLAAKLQLLEGVIATGVREVEATAFVSPSKVPALADAAALAAELPRLRESHGVEFSDLVAGPGGAGRAIAAGMGSIEYVVSAADAHSHANVGRSTAESTDLIADIARIAHENNATVEVIIATAWDCPYDGPTDPERVLDIATAAVEIGADRVAIADTIGTTTPRRVTALIELLRPIIGDLPLGAHFHNTRGAGLASAYAAVVAGVRRLDSSVGGLGGCPFAPGASGNIATEDLVYLLRDSGIATDVDLQSAIHAADVARKAVGHDLPSALLRAGDRILG